MSAHLGLDIGSTSIKLIQVEGSKVKFLSIASNPSSKTITAMTNTEKIALTDIIKSVISEAGVRETKVVASIAEPLTYSKVMKFPVMSSPELATAIKWELDQSVPFPPNDIETSWTIIDKPDKFNGDEKISVYVVAVPTTVSDTYVQILELAGLEPIRLENEVPALTRTFSEHLDDESPSLIVDIGASGTNVTLSGKTKIFNNYYITVGGSVMTRLIADSFSLPVDQAESYKRTYGILKDQLEGRMVVVLKPVIDNLVGEFKKMIISFQDENKGKLVSKLILTGGGSYLLGVIPYLTDALGGLEVVTGDSFAGMAVEEKYNGLGPVFALGMGLAL